MATAAGSDAKIDIGRVVSRGFEVLGRRALPFLLLTLLLGVLPTFLAYRAVTGDGAVFGYGIGWLVSMVCAYLLQATLVRSSILDLSGRDADIAGSLKVAARLLLPMIGLAILTSIIVAIGFVLLIVPGIIAYIMLSVAVPVMVEERSGVFESMRRSRALTKGSRGRIFILVLLFLVAAIVVNMILPFLVGTLGIDDALTVVALMQAIGAGLLALVVGTMLASLYLELRIVKEGQTAEGLADIFA